MAGPSGSSEGQPLAGERLGRVLELIGERTPAPGGGSAAAVAVAIAAALEQMAAEFTLARDEYAGRHERARELHRRAEALHAAALELAERERHSYTGLLGAIRLPADAPDREQLIAAGREEAIASPLELCRRAAEAAELGAELAREGNRNLAGDAICATLLAEAGCQAASALVRINAGDSVADPNVSEAGLLANRAQQARAQALAVPAAGNT